MCVYEVTVINWEITAEISQKVLSCAVLACYFRINYHLYNA